MTNVIVARSRTIQVSTNATAGIIDSTNPVVLKQIPVLSPTSESLRIDHLQDVNASMELDGSTLVYNANTGTYVVKYLDLSEVTGTMDGGNF